MRDVTIIFPVKNDKVILGRKKRGFGEGKINGFGGKVQDGESIEEAALRELFEETGIKARLENLKKVGVIDFYFPPEKAEKWNQRGHIYFIFDWVGEPTESEEMTIENFSFDEIPYGEMWDDDKHWLPKIIAGKKIKAKFEFGEDSNTTKSFEIIEVDGF